MIPSKKVFGYWGPCWSPYLGKSGRIRQVARDNVEGGAGEGDHVHPARHKHPVEVQPKLLVQEILALFLQVSTKLLTNDFFVCVWSWKKSSFLEAIRYDIDMD